MVLEDEWHDDLDVTRVIQTPKIQSFTGQPDIPLESFNPSAHSDAPTSKERKVIMVNCFLQFRAQQFIEKLSNCCEGNSIFHGSTGYPLGVL